MLATWLTQFISFSDTVANKVLKIAPTIETSTHAELPKPVFEVFPL